MPAPAMLVQPALDPLDTPVTPSPPRAPPPARRKRGVLGGWLSMAPLEQTEPDPEPMSTSQSGHLAPMEARRHSSTSFYDPLRPGLVSSSVLSRHGSVYSAAESSPHESDDGADGDHSREHSRPASGDATPTTDDEAQPFDYRSLLRPVAFGSRRPLGRKPKGTRPAPSDRAANPRLHSLSVSSNTPLSGPEPAPKRPKPTRELSFEPPPGLLPLDAHRRRKHRRRAKVILTPRGNNHIVNGGGGLKMTGVEWSGKTLVAVEQEMERLGKKEWMSYSPDPEYLARRLEALRKNLEAQEREDQWRAQQGFGPLYQQKRWTGPEYPATPSIPSQPSEPVSERKASTPSLSHASLEAAAPAGASSQPAAYASAPLASSSVPVAEPATAPEATESPARQAEKAQAPPVKRPLGRFGGFLRVNDPIENAVPHAPMVSPPATPEHKAVALGSDTECESSPASSSTPEDYEMTNALSQFHLRPPTVLTQPQSSSPPAGNASPPSPATPSLGPTTAPAPPPTQAFSQWGAPAGIETAARTAELRVKAEQAAQLARAASADADRLYKALPRVDYASQQDALQQRVMIRDARRSDLEQIADLHCLFGEQDDQPDEDPLFLNRDNYTTSATFLLRLLVDENYVAVVAVAKPLPEPAAPIHIPRPSEGPPIFHPREKAIPEEEEPATREDSPEPTGFANAQAHSAPVPITRRKEQEGQQVPALSHSFDSDAASLGASVGRDDGQDQDEGLPPGSTATRATSLSHASARTESTSPLSPAAPPNEDTNWCPPRAPSLASDQETDRPKSAGGGLLEPEPAAADAIPGPEYLAPPPLQRVMATAPPRGRLVEREIILGVATANICYHPPPIESFDLPHGEAGGPMVDSNRIMDEACSTIHVLTLSVLSTERHQGLGAWLLDTLLDRARDRLMDQHRIATRWKIADRELRQAQSSTPSSHMGSRAPSRAPSVDRAHSTATSLARASHILSRGMPRVKAFCEVHPSNTRACKLYERVGFHHTSTEWGYYRGDRRIPSRVRLTPGGQDAWKYEKWL